VRESKLAGSQERHERRRGGAWNRRRAVLPGCKTAVGSSKSGPRYARDPPPLTPNRLVRRLSALVALAPRPSGTGTTLLLSCSLVAVAQCDQDDGRSESSLLSSTPFAHLHSAPTDPPLLFSPSPTTTTTSAPASTPTHRNSIASLSLKFHQLQQLVQLELHLPSTASRSPPPCRPVARLEEQELTRCKESRAGTSLSR
jgi:hypothetical protein